jgi:hypothetical protein
LIPTKTKQRQLLKFNTFDYLLPIYNSDHYHKIMLCTNNRILSHLVLQYESGQLKFVSLTDFGLVFLTH